MIAGGVTTLDALAFVRAFARDTDGAALVVHQMNESDRDQLIGRLAQLVILAVPEPAEFFGLAATADRYSQRVGA